MVTINRNPWADPGQTVWDIGMDSNNLFDDCVQPRQVLKYIFCDVAKRLERFPQFRLKPAHGLWIRRQEVEACGQHAGRFEMVQYQVARLRHKKSVRRNRALVFEELTDVVQLLLIVSILHPAANEFFAGLVGRNVAQGNFGWEQHVRQRVQQGEPAHYISERGPVTDAQE